MNFKKIKKFTFALILALGFAVAPVLSSLSSVHAQDRSSSRQWERDRKILIMERSAFNQGFRRGWDDARRGLRFNPQRHPMYRTGDRMDRREFRLGYERGFRQR
jgi:hypothetical protein